MRPRHIYRISDAQQSKDWWLSKQHNDIVTTHNDVLLSVYNDDFLSGISTCSSVQIVSVLPLSDWTESAVTEFLLDFCVDKAILTDVDKLGFGKDFWLNFIDLVIEKDYQFSIVTRNKASKFCSNIDRIKDSKTLWNQSEIVYSERVLIAKPECARTLCL